MMHNDTRTSPRPSLHSRFLGAWWGLFIGDALGVPSDGYFNLRKLHDDYPSFITYLDPKEPHPNSEIHRLPPGEPGPGDTLHDRRDDWEKPGTHYHHGMKAGDNTLSALLALELAESITHKSRFDKTDWIERYKGVLLRPDGHRDFYIPTAHRQFAAHLGSGHHPDKSGESDCHVSGLVEASPLFFFRANDADALFRDLGPQIGIVRPSPTLVRAGALYGEILRLVFSGMTVDDACFKKLTHHHHPYLAYPFHRWKEHHTDEHIARHELGQGPAADDALPLALYLAFRHSDSFEKAVDVNAALGGDTCHRGSLVGMLLGAEHGCEGIPARFVNGLALRDRIDAAGDALWEHVTGGKLARAG